MQSSNVIAFPVPGTPNGNRWSVAELIAYWRWQGYRISSNLHGHLVLWRTQ